MDVIVQIEHILVTCAAFVASFGTLIAIVWGMSIKNAERRKEIQLRLAAVESETTSQHGRIELLVSDVSEIKRSMTRVETLVEHAWGNGGRTRKSPPHPRGGGGE